MTHTPGPWRITRNEGRQPHCIRGGNDAVVAFSYYDDLLMDDNSEPTANATLIAAAPELLDALKGMLEWARRVKEKNPGQEVVNALNAIARAEGRKEAT